MKRRRGPHRDRGTGDAARESPASIAARARVQGILERLARSSLQVVVVAPPDATRVAARERAHAAAIVAGRGVLFDQAVAAARDATFRTFARSAFSGTWALTDMAMSVTNAQDRMAAATAIEEAAIAAVVEDLVDDDTIEVLRSTAGDLVMGTSVPQPGSIANFGSPLTLVRNPIALALVGAFAFFLFVVGLFSGSLVTLALGFALIASLVRRRRQPQP